MVVSWENDDLEDAMSSTMTSAEIEQLSAEIQRVSPAFTRLREHLASAVSYTHLTLPTIAKV